MKLIVLSIAVISVLSSCNTTIGVGRDLRLLGGAMESKAEGSGGGGGDAYAPDAGGAPVY